MKPCRPCSTCVLFILASSAPALGQSFVSLGKPAGYFGSVARSVSADGRVVVGHAIVDSSDHDFRATSWTAQTGMLLMPSLPDLPIGIARGVSGDGATIIGYCYLEGGLSRPARWTELGAHMFYLGDLPGGSAKAQANAISDDGLWIVGSSDSSSGVRAFRQPVDGPSAAIGALVSTGTSEALAVSGDGTFIVGDSGNADRKKEAFRWTSSTGMVGLGIPAGYKGTYATGVSDDGQVVVGYAFPTDIHADTQSFRWTPTTGAVIISSPAFAGTQTFAVSADGSVMVGVLTAGPTVRIAGIWDAAHGWRPLTTALSDLGVQPTDWSLSEARDISPDGRFIVGVGGHPFWDEGWLADLGPACAADLNGDGFVDFADYLEFLNLYEAQDPRVDFNHDSFVDFTDYLEFLNLYDAGC